MCPSRRGERRADRRYRFAQSGRSSTSSTPHFNDVLGGPEREFARIWREPPRIVYSRTLQHADCNTTIVREVVPSEVERLNAEPGGDMVVGGANLAATFTRHRLIDEYRIYPQPVVLGAGTPLFRPVRGGCRCSSKRRTASAMAWCCSTTTA